jgi:cob(I)alamin adenosyltransferase
VALGLIDRRCPGHGQGKAGEAAFILTGRNVHPDLVAISDMVTEMRSIKHPYDSGLPARKGIDF